MKKAMFYLLLISLVSCNNHKLGDWNFTSFVKPLENPIIKADSSFTFLCPLKKEVVRWQMADVFNPGAIVMDGKIFLLLRCEDNPAAILGERTSRIGLASSEDGIHFTKYPTPVLYPDSGKYMEYDAPGGCEDPRVVQMSDSTFVMMYTSWNYKLARLSVAFSKDLIHWEKKGPVFAKAENGKYLEMWTKSGSVITQMKKGRLVAAKIHEKYWMYFGEKAINLAWSENMIDWNPLLTPEGQLWNIIEPRKYKFDSNLTECGPPAIISNEGIVLFYNGRNAVDENTDKHLPPGTYSVGKLVLEPLNPAIVKYRSDSCLLKPTLPHELTGQYKAGTTFSEGLVFFKSKWFLYYGTADSFVGVAVSKL